MGKGAEVASVPALSARRFLLHATGTQVLPRGPHNSPTISLMRQLQLLIPTRACIHIYIYIERERETATTSNNNNDDDNDNDNDDNNNDNDNDNDDDQDDGNNHNNNKQQ